MLAIPPRPTALDRVRAGACHHQYAPQFLLLEVVSLKEIRSGVTTAIVDGGRNIIMPPSWEHHGLLSVNKAAAAAGRLYDVYGPLCHPDDLLFRGRWLPELEVGDLLAVMDAGAYFIPNQMNFSNPRPAAVMVDAAGAGLIRERERFENIVQLDRVPPAATLDAREPQAAKATTRLGELGPQVFESAPQSFVGRYQQAQPSDFRRVLS